MRCSLNCNLFVLLDLLILFVPIITHDKCAQDFHTFICWPFSCIIDGSFLSTQLGWVALTLGSYIRGFALPTFSRNKFLLILYLCLWGFGLRALDWCNMDKKEHVLFLTFYVPFSALEYSTEASFCNHLLSVNWYIKFYNIYVGSN